MKKRIWEKQLTVKPSCGAMWQSATEEASWHMYVYEKCKWNHQIVGEIMSKLSILCHQVKLLLPEMDYISLNCWLKGLHGNSQTSQTTAKVIGCSPETDKVLLPKITFVHGEIELVSNKWLHFYCLPFMVLEYTLKASK